MIKIKDNDDFINIAFTSLPEFDGGGLVNNCGKITEDMYIIENDGQFAEFSKEKIKDNYEFVSRYDFREMIASKYFLVRKFQKGELKIKIIDDLELYTLSLRLLKPITSSARIRILCYDKGVQVSSNGKRIFINPKYKTNRVSLDDLKDATSVFNKLLELFTKQPNRLITAVFFFEIAQSRFELLERYINATTAMESLFNTEQFEIAHQISERVALFLGGNNSTKKKLIYENMKRIYVIRSKLVHGQSLLTERMTRDELIDELENYFRQSVIKIIKDRELFTLYATKQDKNKNRIIEYFKILLFNR